MVYISFAGLFLLSVLLTYGYMRYAQRQQWLDIPNVRSSHTTLTPRGGGLVFVALWLMAGMVALWQQLLSPIEAMVLFPGAIMVASIAFCDDRYTISSKWRAAVYFLAAIASVITLGGFPQLILTTHWVIEWHWLGWVIAILAIMWSINLFNFMDGLDGIAAVEALFTLGGGGFFIYQAGAYGMGIAAWMLAVCIAGFLVWNKPPARVFMGDVGSATIGFVIMVLALAGERWYQVPILLWFMLYAVFIVDATVTLLRRLYARQPIYQAHRLHAYQRLHQAGFSHGKVVLCVIVLNSILMCLAVVGFYYRDLVPVLALVGFGIVLGGYIRVEKIKPM